MRNPHQGSPGVPSEADAMARMARHPAERILSFLSAFLTIGLLILLAWNVTYNVKTPADESVTVEALAAWFEVEQDVAALLVKAGGWIVLILFLYVYLSYWIALFNEGYRAASEDLTCNDLISGEPKKILDQYAAILGMKKIPELYFSDHGEPVAIQEIVVYGKKYIVLSTALIVRSTALSVYMMDDRMPALRFKLATKLGNIYMGYNNILFQVLTLPGRYIPGLRSLYIKSLIYSSDRMALEILAKDPNVTITREDIAKTLLLREFDIDTRPLINTDQAIRNRDERFEQMGRLEKALLRISSDDPPLMDRIHAVLDTSGKHGTLL